MGGRQSRPWASNVGRRDQVVTFVRELPVVPWRRWKRERSPLGKRGARVGRHSGRVRVARRGSGPRGGKPVRIHRFRWRRVVVRQRGRQNRKGWVEAIDKPGEVGHGGRDGRASALNMRERCPSSPRWPSSRARGCVGYWISGIRVGHRIDDQFVGWFIDWMTNRIRHHVGGMFWNPHDHHAH